MRTVHYERAIPLLDRPMQRVLSLESEMMDADVIINRKRAQSCLLRPSNQKSNEADAASVDIEPSMLEDHRSCACSYVSVETLDDLEALLPEWRTRRNHGFRP